VDGINLLPKACGEAWEAVRNLSLTGTGNLPASRVTNPSPPLLAPRMDEVCRYSDISKKRMEEFALVKNTATLAFLVSHTRACLRKKNMPSAFISCDKPRYFIELKYVKR